MWSPERQCACSLSSDTAANWFDWGGGGVRVVVVVVVGGGGLQENLMNETQPGDVNGDCFTH